MNQNQEKSLNRRAFVKGAAISTGGLLLARPGIVFGSEANSKIKLGIIGSGGRGQWIADLFVQNAPFQIAAAHDYFADRVAEIGNKHGIAPERRYTGLDGYKELLASDVDAVAIISPPYFHPEQTVAALEAGKHVFLAKPIAVDAPGCQAIAQAAKKCEGKLTTLVDFQTRANEFYQGAAERIHKGMIGEVVTAQVHYHTGRMGPRVQPGSEVARMRNWVFDKALSGDIIVEQNIHVLDVANWFLGATPIKANGAGGRKVRTDVGDCYDHFVVTYWYPNDVLASFSSTQCIREFDDLCVRLHGSLGTADSHYGGDVKIRGAEGGWRGGDTGSIYHDGAVTNIVAFHKSIVEGKYLNNAQESANSTLTSILGREAAYREATVTWDEIIAANQKLDAHLDLPANGPQLQA